MTAPNVPAANTQEYLWWHRGAEDEQKARDEGLSYLARDIRDTLEALGKLKKSEHEADSVYLIGALARIYCPEILRRRYRK